MTQETSESQVLAVEAVRAKAMVDADVATLERITGDDYIHVSSGQVRTKAEFLDGQRRGDYRFESFVVDENHVGIFGEIALMTGSYHNSIRTKAGLQPVKYARHIGVYLCRFGQWTNVAHQARETKRAGHGLGH